jgi:hypothetical protein
VVKLQSKNFSALKLLHHRNEQEGLNNFSPFIKVMFFDKSAKYGYNLSRFHCGRAGGTNIQNFSITEISTNFERFPLF